MAGVKMICNYYFNNVWKQTNWMYTFKEKIFFRSFMFQILLIF